MGFCKRCMGLVLTAVVLATLTPASYAAPPSDRCILVRVKVAEEGGGRALVNTGLDIWESHPDSMVIRVTDDELAEVRDRGYQVEIITEDVYEYLETLSKEGISGLSDEPFQTYRSYDDVIAGLIALEASGVAQTVVIGKTHEGRDIWAVRISDNPTEDEAEPAALFLGCHHAREWISVEVPLYIAQYLADHYDTDAEITHLVDHCEIWIVPVVNPDGYEYSRTRDRLWRKNRRANGDGTFGVDLNRNYGYMWGITGSNADMSSIEYRGPSAFSEPETQAVRDLILAHRFRSLMSYHSYGQMTYMPWGYTLAPCPDDLPMSAMTTRMEELIAETSGAVYTAWADWPDQYVTPGETGDWSYGELGIYSFGIELHPVTSAQGGFVLPASRILPTCEENLPVALYLISLSADDGGIENLMTGNTYGSIQFAINDANEGDEILLDPGLYQESVFVLDKALTLTSTDPNDPALVASTIIKGYRQDAAVTTSGRVGEGSLLAGLTITGETTGVSCCDAFPTLWNSTIGGNGPNAIEFWEGYEPAIVDCNVLGPVVEVNDPRIIAYWELDEAEGVTAHDSIAGHDGALEGSPVWQPDGGMVGGALQLDGIDDCLETPLTMNPSEGAFSVFAWVKGGAPGEVVISQNGGAKWLMIKDDGVLATELSRPDAKDFLVSEVSITDGSWHHVGVTWDGSARTLYVDDINVAEDTQPSLADKSANLYVGASGPTRSRAATFFAGLIDDVRIYNRAVRP